MKQDKKVRCCASRDFYRHQLPRYSSAHADSFRERESSRNTLSGQSLFCHSFLHSAGTYFRFVSAVCIPHHEKQRTKLERDTGGNTVSGGIFLLPVKNRASLTVTERVPVSKRHRPADD